jgi:6-phosphogluconolactonase/glucosamine-6-phosphate isomerase/deaminase
MKCIVSADWDEGTAALTARLRKELGTGKRVLWLLGGGSNIAASVKVMDAITDEESEKLAIFLTDERYGELDHQDSNARQLREAGFQPKQAIFVPTLASGLSLGETEERYAQALQTAMEHADVIIGQFGMGPDGHIAGILPNSPATTATGWVTGYEAPPYVRITMTFEALRRITAAYLFVFGASKQEAVSNLQTETLPLEQQPAQILKELPEAYVYSDQLEEQ